MLGRTRTQREVSEDIELWEDMCIRYRPIYQELRQLIHSGLSKLYDKYNIPDDIHQERFRCILYGSIAVAHDLDNIKNVYKHFEFDYKELSIVYTLTKKYKEN